MRRLKTPSFGFVLTLLVYAGVITFLSWGFATPRLDRIWHLHHELKIGRVAKLTVEDKSLLRQALKDHPTLAAALLPRGDIGLISANREGWIETPEVTLVRTGDSTTQQLQMNVQTSPEHLPFKVRLSGENWEEKLDVAERRLYTIDLPPTPGHSELITLRVKGKRFRADPAILGIELHFDGESSWLPSDEDGDEDEDQDQDEASGDDG